MRASHATSSRGTRDPPQVEMAGAGSVTNPLGKQQDGEGGAAAPAGRQDPSPESPNQPEPSAELSPPGLGEAVCRPREPGHHTPEHRPKPPAGEWKPFTMWALSVRARGCVSALLIAGDAPPRMQGQAGLVPH